MFFIEVTIVAGLGASTTENESAGRIGCEPLKIWTLYDPAFMAEAENETKLVV